MLISKKIVENVNKDIKTLENLAKSINEYASNYSVDVTDINKKIQNRIEFCKSILAKANEVEV